MTMIMKSVADDGGLSKNQLDLVERFEADFNAIEQFLRKAIRDDGHEPFTRLVNKYVSSHPTWRDAEFLRTAASVRNAIVHGKTEPYCHVAVPTPTVVTKLRACREIPRLRHHRKRPVSIAARRGFSRMDG